MQKDMEISCDEAVIKQMPFEERKAYSHLLLQMAAAKSRPLCTNAAFGADIIEERILHIMKFKKPTKLIACFTVIAVSVCLRCRLDAGYKGRELYQCSFSKIARCICRECYQLPTDG